MTSKCFEKRRRAPDIFCLVAVLAACALPLHAAAVPPQPISGIGQLEIYQDMGEPRKVVSSDSALDACGHTAYSRIYPNGYGNYPGKVDFVPDGGGRTVPPEGYNWVHCTGTATITPVDPRNGEPLIRQSVVQGVFVCPHARLGNGNPVPPGEWQARGYHPAIAVVVGPPPLYVGSPGSSMACACQNWNGANLRWNAKHGYCMAPERPIVLGFFNGVWNTEEQAGSGVDALKEVVGPMHGDIQIRYEKFYNQTGHSNGNTEAQDIAETFIQRSNELDGVLANRWEHYWELLSGRHRTEGSLTDRLLGGLRAGSAALSDLIDSAFSSMLAGFVKGLAQLMSNPPTYADMAAHLSRLQALADEGNNFVLVAHSQGNLFVNLAHDRLRDTRPGVKKAVVHVAPASPTTRGDYVMADIDLVINGLRNFGYASVKQYNFWIKGRLGFDLSGHTLVGTYLDGQRHASTSDEWEPKTTARAHVKSMIVKALDQVAAP